MATSTINSFLMYKTGTPSAYAKLVDIKDYPDLCDAPEEIETTTLSNSARTYIEGLQAGSQKQFTANYDKTDFTTIDGLKGVEQELALYFGVDSNDAPDGNEGKFEFKGYVSVSLVGKSVGEVREMLITITMSSEVSAS